MSPESALDSKTEKSLADRTFLRVVQLSSRLILPPEKDFDIDARQRISKADAKNLLNGKFHLLGNNSFDTLLYAGIETEGSWVRIGQNIVGVKIRFEDMEQVAKCYFQQRDPQGVWVTKFYLGEIPFEEFERIVHHGEIVTGLAKKPVVAKPLETNSSSSQIHRLPGAIIGNKGF